MNKVTAGMQHRLRNKTGASAPEGIAARFDDLWDASTQCESGSIDVIDMFSGCGGMSAGFRAYNAIQPTFRNVLAIDIDDDANCTYERNLGITPQKLDIGQIARDPAMLGELFRTARGGRNGPLVLIGCAPCQGFSSHRNSSGEGDGRNSLFGSFTNIAAEIRPDAIIIENVPEILTDRYWPVVEKARNTLRAAGYFTSIAVHDMAEFGVPQNRFRAVMIAMKKPFQMPKGQFQRGSYRTVREAIGDLPPLLPGQKVKSDLMHVTASHRKSTVDTIRAVPKDGGNRPPNVGPECLRRAGKRQGKAVYEDVYGRLWWDRPSITVTAYARNPASGRYVHPEQDRGLSVREAALLQGFPKSFQFAGSFDSKFRQIGNAVPPIFAAYLGEHISYELTANRVMQHQEGIVRSIGPSFSRLIPALKAGHRVLASDGSRERGIERIVSQRKQTGEDCEAARA